MLTDGQSTSGGSATASVDLRGAAANAAPCPPRAEIGVALTGAGVFFLFLGVVLLFDKALLAFGNVRCERERVAAARASHGPPHARHVPRWQLMFLAGVLMLIGLERTRAFFFQQRKAARPRLGGRIAREAARR